MKQHRRCVYKRDYKVSTVKLLSDQLACWSVALAGRVLALASPDQCVLSQVRHYE